VSPKILFDYIRRLRRPVKTSPEFIINLRHKTYLLKDKTKLVQINDVFLLQIKYNAIGYLSAFTKKMKLYSRSFKPTYLQPIIYFHSKEKKNGRTN